MKIGIVGGGIVGRATARCWLEHCEDVKVWDLINERCTHRSLADVLMADIVFVCIPEQSLGDFFDKSRTVWPKDDINWVIKSTVPIGTTRRLRDRYKLKNIVHSPEFLTARCAMTDAQMPARNIVGYPDFVPSEENTDQHPVWDAYLRRWPHVPMLRMRSDESEAVKLMQNGIFAVTVSLWNELRSLSDALGLDWNTVRESILSDGRISPSHTQVPGHDGQFGWGGSCLGKDLQHLISTFQEHVEAGKPIILSAADIRNYRDRKRQ